MILTIGKDGPGHSPVIQYFPSMYKVLGSTAGLKLEDRGTYE